ncbi:interferon-induced very large GTPase 1-like [Phyllostomus discolor]|uniref:Interferon-induced very large GTPase 1-like n=1 Tax=Phyllostomus discolor TaxID=89673 RepID=A0A7E6E429_9CHIR|nr:interferon-induced very large GTPase 1-like [Phyllostomus discolor]
METHKINFIQVSQIKKMRPLIHMKTCLKVVKLPLFLKPLLLGPIFTLWIFRWQFCSVQMILPDNIFSPNFPYASFHPLLTPNPFNSEIEFSLWSLRQIRKSWQEASKSPKYENINYKNKQMCCVSTPIVSFIRVGNNFSSSKSQIMNSLLSKHKHDVFFHLHCRGSTKDCLLMKGVVEVSWFCPGGEDEDRFDNCLTFTNLYGDAKEHKKQLSFLQEVSSLIVVFVSSCDYNKENCEIVCDPGQSPKPLICLLDNKEKTMVNNANQKVRIGIKNRNEAELTQEHVATIKFLLELSDTILSLEDCAPYAHKQGFLIDEDQ